jgi:hypothetical protein
LSQLFKEFGNGLHGGFTDACQCLSGLDTQPQILGL